MKIDGWLLVVREETGMIIKERCGGNHYGNGAVWYPDCVMALLTYTVIQNCMHNTHQHKFPSFKSVPFM